MKIIFSIKNLNNKISITSKILLRYFILLMVLTTAFVSPAQACGALDIDCYVRETEDFINGTIDKIEDGVKETVYAGMDWGRQLTSDQKAFVDAFLMRPPGGGSSIYEIVQQAKVMKNLKLEQVVRPEIWEMLHTLDKPVSPFRDAIYQIYEQHFFLEDGIPVYSRRKPNIKSGKPDFFFSYPDSSDGGGSDGTESIPASDRPRTVTSFSFPFQVAGILNFKGSTSYPPFTMQARFGVPFIQSVSSDGPNSSLRTWDIVHDALKEEGKGYFYITIAFEMGPRSLSKIVSGAIETNFMVKCVMTKRSDRACQLVTVAAQAQADFGQDYLKSHWTKKLLAANVGMIGVLATVMSSADNGNASDEAFASYLMPALAGVGDAQLIDPLANLTALSDAQVAEFAAYVTTSSSRAMRPLTSAARSLMSLMERSNRVAVAPEDLALENEATDDASIVAIAPEDLALETAEVDGLGGAAETPVFERYLSQAIRFLFREAPALANEDAAGAAGAAGVAGAGAPDAGVPGLGPAVDLVTPSKPVEFFNSQLIEPQLGVTWINPAAIRQIENKDSRLVPGPIELHSDASPDVFRFGILNAYRVGLNFNWGNANSLRENSWVGRIRFFPNVNLGLLWIPLTKTGDKQVGYYGAD